MISLFFSFLCGAALPFMHRRVHDKLQSTATTCVRPTNGERWGHVVQSVRLWIRVGPNAIICKSMLAQSLSCPEIFCLMTILPLQRKSLIRHKKIPCVALASVAKPYTRAVASAIFNWLLTKKKNVFNFLGNLISHSCLIFNTKLNIFSIFSEEQTMQNDWTDYWWLNLLVGTMYI